MSEARFCPLCRRLNRSVAGISSYILWAGCWNYQQPKFQWIQQGWKCLYFVTTWSFLGVLECKMQTSSFVQFNGKLLEVAFPMWEWKMPAAFHHGHPAPYSSPWSCKDSCSMQLPNLELWVFPRIGGSTRGHGVSMFISIDFEGAWISFKRTKYM